MARVPQGAFEVERRANGLAIDDPDRMQPVLSFRGRAVRADPGANVHHTGCGIDDRGRKDPPMVIDQVHVDVSRAVDRPTWSPVKGSSARFPPIGSATVARQRFFWISATDTDIISAQHFWTRGLETAGAGCYDAVAIARTAGFRMLVMSRIHHAAIVPGSNSAQSIRPVSSGVGNLPRPGAA